MRRLLGRLRHWLFDFSAGHAEGRRWERILRVALAETTTEEEFLALARRMVEEEDPAKSETRWGFFLMRIAEYTTKETGGRRAGAERMLEHLPRLYGYKRDGDG